MAICAEKNDCLCGRKAMRYPRNGYTYLSTRHGIIAPCRSCTASSKAGIGFSMSWHAQRMSSGRRKQSWKWSSVAAIGQSRAAGLALLVSAPWYLCRRWQRGTENQDMANCLPDKIRLLLASWTAVIRTAEIIRRLVYPCQRSRPRQLRPSDAIVGISMTWVYAPSM